MLFVVFDNLEGLWGRGGVKFLEEDCLVGVVGVGLDFDDYCGICIVL